MNRKLILKSVMTALLLGCLNTRAGASKHDQVIIGVLSALGSASTAVAGYYFYNQYTQKQQCRNSSENIQNIKNALAVSQEHDLETLNKFHTENERSARCAREEEYQKMSRANKKVIKRRQALWNQNLVKETMARMSDPSEAQKYIALLPTQTKRDLDQEIQAWKTKNDVYQRASNDKEAEKEIEAVKKMFAYQLNAPQAKLKDTITGDYSDGKRMAITHFCNYLEGEKGKISKLLNANISQPVKNDVQKTHDQLLMLLRNTRVWLDADIKREHSEHQEYKKKELQFENEKEISKTIEQMQHVHNERDKRDNEAILKNSEAVMAMSRQMTASSERMEKTSAAVLAVVNGIIPEMKQLQSNQKINQEQLNKLLEMVKGLKADQEQRAAREAAEERNRQEHMEYVRQQHHAAHMQMNASAPAFGV